MDERVIPLGELIRRVRTTRTGLSARELSSQAGLSPSYVTKLEAGEIEPSLKAFAHVVRALGMTSHEVAFCVSQEGLR